MKWQSQFVHSHQIEWIPRGKKYFLPLVIAVIGISYVRLRDQNGKSMEEKNPIYLRSSPPSAMWICLVQCKIKIQKIKFDKFLISLLIVRVFGFGE